MHEDIRVDESSPSGRPLPTLEADLIAKVDAGAALVYAIFHGGVEFAKVLPDPVVRAYARACEVYRVRRS